MMSANLVGFAIGIEGMRYMVQQLFGSWQGGSNFEELHTLPLVT